ncbi:MAG: SPFH domain-containing protein [Phycisphaerales bacterium JB039]
MADAPENTGAGQSPFDETRQASVTLRPQRGAPEAGDLDTANKSLADAFRLSFRVLQLGMLALVVVYLVSGFQTVDEGWRGIRMLFGRPISEELEPGFTPSWPYPLGELVRVKVQADAVDMLDEFWPRLEERDKNKSDAELAGMFRSLAPDRDNSLITADYNLAHLRVKVQYRRTDVRDFISNIYQKEDNERRIIRHAVKRAVVHTVAHTPIEDLLKESAGGDLQGRIRRLAQDTLDQVDAGLTIDTISIDKRTAPHAVLDSFDRLQNARQDAESAKVQADTDRQTALNQVAGPAAETVLELIRRYEEATDLGDEAAKDAMIDKIAALFRGEPVELDGEIVDVRLAGEAETILREADNTRARLVAERRSARDLFDAKLAQIEAASPAMVLHGDWVNAFNTFVNRDTIEVMLLPPGPSEVRLNPDPDIRRLIERQLRLQENIKAREERDRQQREAANQIDTKERLMDGG